MDVLFRKMSEENKNNKTEKIETCYGCGIEFNMDKDDSSHYHYGKYPLCNRCSEYYAFFDEGYKKTDKEEGL